MTGAGSLAGNRSPRTSEYPFGVVSTERSIEVFRSGEGSDRSPHTAGISINGCANPRKGTQIATWARINVALPSCCATGC